MGLLRHKPAHDELPPDAVRAHPDPDAPNPDGSPAEQPAAAPAPLTLEQRVVIIERYLRAQGFGG